MTIVNNPARHGQKATEVELHGPYSRFALYAIHTRFEAVEWFVDDAESIDETGLPETVVQTASEEEAREALRQLCDGAEDEFARAEAAMEVYPEPRFYSADFTAAQERWLRNEADDTLDLY